MHSGGLFLGPTQYRIWPHTRIYRCYNCKQLGNLAKTCPNNARYGNCGLEWTDERTVQNLLRASTLLALTSSKIQSLTVHINPGIHYYLSLDNPTPRKDLAWILTFSFQIVKISMSIQARIFEVALLWNNLLYFLYHGSLGCTILWIIPWLLHGGEFIVNIHVCLSVYHPLTVLFFCRKCVSSDGTFCVNACNQSKLPSCHYSFNYLSAYLSFLC